MYVVIPTALLDGSDIEVNGDSGSETVAATMDIDVEATGGDIYLAEDAGIEFVDESDWNVVSDVDETPDFVVDTAAILGDATSVYDLAGTVAVSDTVADQGAFNIALETELDGESEGYYDVTDSNGDDYSGVYYYDETDASLESNYELAYKISEDETLTFAFSANKTSGGDAWERFEVEYINYYGEDDTNAYRYQLTDSLDMIDDLETDREFVNYTN
jgi:hypothetical protein